MIISLSILLCGVIVTPIRKLQKASEKIAKGDYSNRLEWKSGDEFENLCNAFNGMTEALMQKEKSGGGGIEPLLFFEPVLNNNRTAWYNRDHRTECGDSVTADGFPEDEWGRCDEQIYVRADSACAAVLRDRGGGDQSHSSHVY